jgi:predicted transcriptional regulator
MARSLTEMAAQIANAQAYRRNVPVDEMAHFIKRTFETLQHIKEREEATQKVSECGKPAGDDPKKSGSEAKAVCPTCGKEL